MGGGGVRGMGYLSVGCAPGSSRGLNSTPRAGLGFLETVNTIHQHPVRLGCIPDPQCNTGNGYGPLISPRRCEM